MVDSCFMVDFLLISNKKMKIQCYSYKGFMWKQCAKVTRFQRKDFVKIAIFRQQVPLGSQKNIQLDFFYKKFLCDVQPNLSNSSCRWMVVNITVSWNWGKKQKPCLGPTHLQVLMKEYSFIVIGNQKITLPMYIWQNPNVYLSDKS